jgi:MFS family permease
MNTWIATIYVSQRNISVIEGANLATVFFASLTVTRVILGFIASNFKTKNVIFFGIILSIIGVGIMFIKSTDMHFLYLNVAILGVGIAPIIPFFNHYLKTLFGENNVGEILGYCSIFSLTGIGISSFCATLVVRFFGIDVIQVYIMAVAVILLLIFSYIAYRANKNIKA